MNLLEPDSIASNPIYEKFYRIPAIYYTDWLNRYAGGFSGKHVLDFGCGEGLAALGTSMFCNAASVVGVDIGEDFQHLKDLVQPVGVDRIPDTVSFRRIQPAEDLGDEIFDVIISWSVLEHVSQDLFDKQMRVLYKSLKAGGMCVFQVAPLYYAPFGSHLFGLHEPWEHLTAQTNLLRDKISKATSKEQAEGAWNCFITLNRFTDSELISRIRNADFHILNIYETFVQDVPSPDLLVAFNRDVLTKEQVLIVCRKE